MPAFTEQEFRNALGLFPTGVTVVTARNREDDSLIGFTVSSFNSVSLDPPLILFSVAHTSMSLEPLGRAEAFAVNVLRRAHTEISNRFARAATDKWPDVRHVAGRTGAPVFPFALASFECTHHARYEGGDHEIFVGRVEAFETHREPDPLIFFRGGYRGIEETDADQHVYDALALHGW